MGSPLITPELVAIDLVAADRDEVTRHLIGLLAAAGRVTDADGFHADVRAREAQMATGMPGGIGLPHARRLVHESFRSAIQHAPDAVAVADIVTREVIPS